MRVHSNLYVQVALLKQLCSDLRIYGASYEQLSKVECKRCGLHVADTGLLLSRMSALCHPSQPHALAVSFLS